MVSIRAIAIAMICAPVAAHAQDAADDTGALDEIVVTAQKREQALVDVPISISVVDAATLAATRSYELRDLSRYVPNFSVERQGAIDTIFIRGVGGGGRNIGFSTRAGVYVDGVYAGQFASINQDTLDIARVEVLRGPQGQLFGRNTVSGAVSIVTERPGSAFEGRVDGGIGNKDLFEIRGMVNAPLGEGVALRVSASHRERDGFTLNVPTGTDLDNIDRSSARAQLSADLSDGVRLDLAADYSRDRSNKQAGEAITDTFGTGPAEEPGAFRTPYNRDPRQRIEFAGGSATLNWDLSDTATLTAISGYRWTRYDRTNDLDYASFDFFFIDFDQSFRQFSQEVRVAFGKGGPLSGVAGLYYFDESAKSLSVVSGGSMIGFLGLGLQPGPGGIVSARVKTKSYAAFGSADWELTDRLTLNLGARFSHEKLRIVDYSISAPAVLGLASLPDYDDARSVDSFDPTIGLSFKLSDRSNAYVKYARGFKSGGWNVDFISLPLTLDGVPFKTERVDSGEVGFKTENTDRTLRFNAAAFYAVYDNYQINQFVDIGFGQTSLQLRNAAKVTSWGAEASVQAAPVKNLLLTADLGYTHAEFDRFPDGGGPGVDLDGNRLPYAPRLTASAGASYSVPIGFGSLDLSAQVSHKSGAFSGPENIATQKLDARTTVDARLELVGDGRHWSLALWGRNLFDERWIDNRVFDFFQTQLVEYGEPRTYGISGKLSF